MHRQLLRIGLWFLALSAVLVGVWAAFAPRSFYDDFPGLGRSWVAPDGPYNEHLVRDVGELNLVLAVVTIGAAVTLLVPFVRAVLVGWLVYGVLHLVYHTRHTEPLETGDAVASLTSLALVPILAIVLLVLTGSRARGQAGDQQAVGGRGV